MNKEYGKLTADQFREFIGKLSELRQQRDEFGVLIAKVPKKQFDQLMVSDFNWSQWIDTFPKIRMLSGEVERDRWLTREEAERLIRVCPAHLAALVRYALATGCRASEITGLEWNRVDLDRRTAWLNQTKNGTPRWVPLKEDAIEV